MNLKKMAPTTGRMQIGGSLSRVPAEMDGIHQSRQRGVHRKGSARDGCRRGPRGCSRGDCSGSLGGAVRGPAR